MTVALLQIKNTNTTLLFSSLEEKKDYVKRFLKPRRVQYKTTEVAPDATSFNCGAQNIGLRLFGDVATHCPHEYSLMMSEASIKEAVYDRRYSDERTASGELSGDSDPGRNDQGSEPVGEYDPYAGTEA